MPPASGGAGGRDAVPAVAGEGPSGPVPAAPRAASAIAGFGERAARGATPAGSGSAAAADAGERAARGATPAGSGRAAADAGRPSVPGPGQTDELFRVLADPTRRRILDLLAEHGTLTVGQLAASFPDLVASGISKHLMGLRAAGLVTATRNGRLRLYRIDPAAMSAALEPWLARYAPYWSGALDRLRALAEGDSGRSG